TPLPYPLSLTRSTVRHCWESKTPCRYWCELLNGSGSSESGSRTASYGHGAICHRSDRALVPGGGPRVRHDGQCLHVGFHESAVGAHLDSQGVASQSVHGSGHSIWYQHTRRASTRGVWAFCRERSCEL